MATELPIGGTITVAPQHGTPAAITFDGDDIVFGTAVYRQSGVDVQQTLQNGDIERIRQSLNIEISWDTYGDDTDFDAGAMYKENCETICYEDDGTTQIGTTAYGSLSCTFNEGSNTTSWTFSGKSGTVNKVLRS